MKQLTPIDDIHSAPFPAIARLETKRRRVLKNAYFHGTGALIKGRYILTAAHNLYHVPVVSAFKRALVALGYNKGEAIAHMNKTYFRSATRCAQGFSFNDFIRDFAIIDLGRDLEAPHTTFRLPSDNELDALSKEGLPLHFAGYPGEHHGGKTLKAATCNKDEYNYDGNFLKYAIDTATGNSGGPVWFEKDKEFILAGVHVSEGTSVALNSKNLREIHSWTGA